MVAHLHGKLTVLLAFCAVATAVNIPESVAVRESSVTSVRPAGDYRAVALSSDGQWLFATFAPRPRTLARLKSPLDTAQSPALSTVTLPGWLATTDISLSDAARLIAVCGLDVERSAGGGEEGGVGSLLLYAWDLQLVRQIRDDDLRACKISGDGKYVLGGGENTFWLYSRDGGAVAHFDNCVGEGFPDFDLSDDGSVVLVSCALYDRAGNELMNVRLPEGPVGFPAYSGAVSRNAKYALLSNYFAPMGQPSLSRVLLYDVSTHSIIWDKQINSGVNVPIVVSDGSVAYVEGLDLVVLNRDGSERWRDRARPGWRHSGVHLSPDEKLLLAVAKLRDGKAAILDINTGTRLAEVDASDVGTKVAFSGSRIAFGVKAGRLGSLKVFDVIAQSPASTPGNSMP